MRLLLRRRRDTSARITGTARLGRRTKDLVKRLEPGEIAVIDHEDLDRVAADGLVAAGVAAVVNAAPSITGRYPNGGPIRLVAAGIPLVDDAGPDVFRLRDGDVVRIVDGEVRRGDELVATGKVRDQDEIEAAMEAARAAIGVELERFAENTLEYVRHEAPPDVRAARAPADVHEVQGAARARRRARSRLPRGPRAPAPVHPPVPARAHWRSTAAPTLSSRWASSPT